MSMLDQLQEMGFERGLAEKALRETGESGLIEAVEWLDAQQKEVLPVGVAANTDDGHHKEDALRLDSIVTEGKNESAAVVDVPASTAQKAMSFKCDECGKMLVDDAAVMFHAARTKHEAFSESTEAIKPMSEEEKKARLNSLQQKLHEARVKKEENERIEALEREKRRRREGQSVAKLEEEKKELEMKKMVDLKRREKREDAEARKRVLEQIRLDHEARTKALESHVISQSIDKPTVMGNTSNEKDYSFCQIQVRLPNGAVVKEKFKAEEPLSHVRLWIELNGGKGLESKSFTLMTPFPKRIFKEEDMAAPLKSLGLVPSASLVVSGVSSTTAIDQ